MSIEITLCTPTYNRAYIIEKLYHSLQKQTRKSFEWLVIDDGSVDNTESLLRKWQKEKNDFVIRYYKTSNGGKHRAVNYSLDLAQGDYYMVVDSDDYLTDDAVEKLCNWMEEIKDNKLIMGVVANKGYSNQETPNNYFKEKFLDKNLLDMNTFEENGKKVLNGERAICFKTDFHKKYKYPEIVDEKFITEAVVYNRMANDGFKMRFFNDIIWIYEYLQDGLSCKGMELYLQNPMGYGIWIKEKMQFSHMRMLERFKVYYSFSCDMKKYYNVEMIAKCLRTKKIMICFCLFIHRVWRLKNRQKPIY